MEDLPSIMNFRTLQTSVSRTTVFFQDEDIENHKPILFASQQNKKVIKLKHEGFELKEFLDI